MRVSSERGGALSMDGSDHKQPEDTHERHARLAAEGKLLPLEERLRAPRPTADERVLLLEDRLAEMDEHGAQEERSHFGQRLDHGIAALVTVGLLLAWVLYTDMPVLLGFLLALLGGRQATSSSRPPRGHGRSRVTRAGRIASCPACSLDVT
jgi:hypothetical protein